MNNTLKITIIVVAVLFGAALLLAGGLILGRNFFGRTAFADGRFPFSFMHRFDDGDIPYGMGPGMMGRGFDRQDGFRQQSGMGRGLMGRGFYSQKDNRQPYGMGPGMMGGNFSAYTGEPLSIEEARDAFNNYLADIGDEDLVLHEVMVFSQNAYAVIQEESTGMSAMELLVDHATGNVFPEYGPNMMWNYKYGMMGGRGRNIGTGACCTGVYSEDGDFEAMSLTLEEAQAAAQSYLDKELPGAAIAEEGYTFYGYYTFDYELDGEMVGMLSVNGYSSDIWQHTWHGDFVTEEEFN